MKTPRGITMIEILVVIAIIGAVSAMAFPAFSSWLAKRRLAADFGALMALTQQLQIKAQSQAGTARLVCDNNQLSGQVSRVNATPPCQGLVTAFSGGNITADLTEGLPNRGKVQVGPCSGPGVPLLVFHADGSVCRAGASLMPITLTYAGDSTMSNGAYRLTVSSATGFMTRQRYIPGRQWQDID